MWSSVDMFLNISVKSDKTNSDFPRGDCDSDMLDFVGWRDCLSGISLLLETE